MSREDEVVLIRQIISRNNESHEDVISRIGGERAHSVVEAALRVAVAFQFPPGTPDDMPKKFGAYLKNRFQHSDERVTPSVVEAVIRSAQEGTPPSETYSPAELLTTMFLVTYAIMSRARLNREAVNNYVEQVLAIAGPAPDEVIPSA